MTLRSYLTDWLLFAAAGAVAYASQHGRWWLLAAFIAFVVVVVVRDRLRDSERDRKAAR
jgi:hypothetical protein